MSTAIPQGKYNLIIVVGGNNAEKLSQCALISEYGINLDEALMQGSNKDYYEVQLDSADLRDICHDLAKQNLSADIQVLPRCSQQTLGTGITFNAYIRQGDEISEIHINDKSDDNIAHEFSLLLAELEKDGFDKASEIIKRKILEFHPHGWV